MRLLHLLVALSLPIFAHGEVATTTPPKIDKAPTSTTSVLNPAATTTASAPEETTSPPTAETIDWRAKLGIAASASFVVWILASENAELLSHHGISPDTLGAAIALASISGVAVIEFKDAGVNTIKDGLVKGVKELGTAAKSAVTSGATTLADGIRSTLKGHGGLPGAAAAVTKEALQVTKEALQSLDLEGVTPETVLEKVANWVAATGEQVVASIAGTSYPTAVSTQVNEPTDPDTEGGTADDGQESGQTSRAQILDPTAQVQDEHPNAENNQHDTTNTGTTSATAGPSNNSGTHRPTILERTHGFVADTANAAVGSATDAVAKRFAAFCGERGAQFWANINLEVDWVQALSISLPYGPQAALGGLVMWGVGMPLTRLVYQQHQQYQTRPAENIQMQASADWQLLRDWGNRIVTASAGPRTLLDNLHNNTLNSNNTYDAGCRHLGRALLNAGILVIGYSTTYSRQLRGDPWASYQGSLLVSALWYTPLLYRVAKSRPTPPVLALINELSRAARSLVCTMDSAQPANSTADLDAQNLAPPQALPAQIPPSQPNPQQSTDQPSPPNIKTNHHSLPLPTSPSSAEDKGQHPDAERFCTSFFDKYQPTALSHTSGGVSNLRGLWSALTSRFL